MFVLGVQIFLFSILKLDDFIDSGNDLRSYRSYPMNDFEDHQKWRHFHWSKIKDLSYTLIDKSWALEKK